MTPGSTLPAVGGEGHESHRLAATVAGGQNYKGAFKNRGEKFVLRSPVFCQSLTVYLEFFSSFSWEHFRG